VELETSCGIGRDDGGKDRDDRATMVLASPKIRTAFDIRKGTIYSYYLSRFILNMSHIPFKGGLED